MKLAVSRSITLSASILACVSFYALYLPRPPFAQEQRQSQIPAAIDLKHLRQADAPIVLCIDDTKSVGGQPSNQAYAKAAASGFRSVLTLRAPTDGVDAWRERLMVEKNNLRYFTLDVLSINPRQQQLDDFLRWVREKSNHPMLINCAFAERVAPYMMIFNLLERGWSEERAVEEASKSGLRRDDLQALARRYLKSQGSQGTPEPSR